MQKTATFLTDYNCEGDNYLELHINKLVRQVEYLGLTYSFILKVQHIFYFYSFGHKTRQTLVSRVSPTSRTFIYKFNALPVCDCRRHSHLLWTFTTFSGLYSPGTFVTDRFKCYLVESKVFLNHTTSVEVVSFIIFCIFIFIDWKIFSYCRFYGMIQLMAGI